MNPNENSVRDVEEFEDELSDEALDRAKVMAYCGTGTTATGFGHDRK